MEFSKKITVTILIFWMFANIAIGAVYALTNIDLRFLMEYINPAYVAATSGYLLKAGVENYQKIKNNSTDQKVNL